MYTIEIYSNNGETPFKVFKTKNYNIEDNQLSFFDEEKREQKLIIFNNLNIIISGNPSDLPLGR